MRFRPFLPNDETEAMRLFQRKQIGPIPVLSDDRSLHFETRSGVTVSTNGSALASIGGLPWARLAAGAKVSDRAPPGSTKLQRLQEIRRGASVTLSADDLHEVEDALSQIELVGERYPAAISDRQGGVDESQSGAPPVRLSRQHDQET
ncbi:hypothetical protein [Sphingomonas endolithica]|uniref:hypothetical protein n=1 Tax=Sphingomonas endolithica TaxID=2972485 RepID=UPI0021AEEEB9|nr:hypothetical protein [Sphingomonas sp. ZFBP2030]